MQTKNTNDKEEKVTVPLQIKNSLEVQAPLSVHYIELLD